MANRLMSVVLCLLACTGASAADAAERPPNFLFILGDNLGKDWFGCYGSEEQCTPQIDKLAAGGVRFEHCYMTALCSTSRAALLTGRYGFRTGWQTHHDAAIYGGGGFDWQRETTFARVLQTAGYATAITGKWQINDLYEQPDALKRHGFEEHLVWTGALEGEGNAEGRWRASLAAGREMESRYWDPVVFKNGQRLEMRGRFGPDVYVEYLLDFIQRQRDRPFLAYYATPLTHIPVVTTPGSPQKDAAERDQFAGMVRYLDQQVGHLLSELERLGLRERTIIVFTTDNGSPRRLGGSVAGKRVPGGLGTQSEPGIDVPLIVNCPGAGSAGSRQRRAGRLHRLLPHARGAGGRGAAFRPGAGWPFVCRPDSRRRRWAGGAAMDLRPVRHDADRSRPALQTLLQRCAVRSGGRLAGDG